MRSKILVCVRILFAALVLGAIPAMSAEPADKELPIPEGYRGQLKRATDIGRQIYILDKVSTTATDVLLHHVTDNRKAGVRGYLALQEGDENGRPKDSYLAMFFTGESPPRISFEVRIKPNEKPSFQAFDPPKTPSTSILEWFRARQVAIAALPPGGQPVNPVVLPPYSSDESGVLVYLLASTRKEKVVVFGRHYLALVPLGATSVAYIKPLSHTILEMPIQVPDGATLTGLFVSQVLTDWPTETHVFASLLHRMPVYVGTTFGIWRVDGEKITLTSNLPPKDPK